ncbi:MAG: hypothetical protein F6K36_29580 [Symploca sp. SIO3C6]|uniref:Uncharacterized protein n=1 Tax=Symploca sp. SIO1C4 TaxID=2607765 RepID=A0A6B3NKJ3_9CYAN|nr:hypothetical protein [Symploca sp. SIO3C6]NER32260.1 hypothetical protein [Symploca sp. SIO1C4]NET10728.1 hypothetical protein [Symploca sp. SIO2B6]NET48742.1 hypothetical protein [Merismopedia sp. SIO2A8]
MSEKRNGQELIRLYLPAEMKENFKLYCSLKGTTMSEQIKGFINSLLSSKEFSYLLEQKLAKHQASEVDSIKELIRQNYFQLMDGGINQQRLQELAFGEKPSAKEREKIKKILGLDELPEN